MGAPEGPEGQCGISRVVSVVREESAWCMIEEEDEDEDEKESSPERTDGIEQGDRSGRPGRQT